MRSTWFRQSQAPKYKIPYVFNGYHTSRYLDEVFMKGAKIYCYEMAEQNPLNRDDPKVSFYVAHRGIYNDVYDLKCFTDYCLKAKGYGCEFYMNDPEVYNQLLEIYHADLLYLKKGQLARKLMK